MSSKPITRPIEELEIRSLDLPEDLQKAEQAQIETWGYCELDVVPAAIFSVARHFGGQALGAFDGERMAGFALAFGAVEHGHIHLHSHMVAVVPDYQNRGLGRRIKLAQRQDALSRGVRQIVWTFDPLQVKNAYFNIARLGGVGVRYLPNLYGKTSSPLHGGLPTDRLVVEWNLESPRVLKALSGDLSTTTTNAQAVLIPHSSKDVAIAERLAGQQHLRERLLMLLSKGYVVTGIERNQTASKYILEKASIDSWRSNED